MKRILMVSVGVLMLLAIGVEPLLRQFRYDLGTGALEAPATAGTALSPVSCWFSDGWFERSDCAWLHPREQGEAQTALPLVVLRAGLFARSKSATVYLSGGPGGSSYLYQEAMPYWREWMQQRLGLDHDLVLYDQRGSGYALPRLACEPADAISLQGVLDGIDSEAWWAAVMPALEACAADVPERERSAGLYSTATAAQDLRELVRALRDELGYESVRLYGVSYGSRLAQVALARPLPEVERVVLDGFYPAGLALEASFAADFASILDAMDADCVARARCEPSAGRLRQLLNRGMDRLRAEPVRLTLSSALELPPELEAARSLLLTSETLFALTEHLLTTGADAALLRERLQEAADGRIGEAWQAVLNEWLWGLADPEFSTLAQLLIECRDNPPLLRAEVEAGLVDYPEWAEALAMPELGYALCGRLGVRPVPLNASVIEQPTLLLAAEFDPRTPTTLAQRASREFPKLTTLALPRSGHSLTDLDDCAARAAGAFLNDGTLPIEGACP